MKNIFNHFYRAFIEVNKTIFLEGESKTFKSIRIILRFTLLTLLVFQMQRLEVFTKN